MELSQQVKQVVYWTNPLVSGGVFLVGLFAFFLVGLCNYSSISVVCYILILNLTVRLGHMHGGRVLGEMNVLPKRPLPVPPDHFVTEEQVAAHVGAITAGLNTALQTAYALLCGDATPAALRTLASLCALALASRLLGTTGLLFLCFLAAFTLPKGYQAKKAEVDAIVAKARQAAEEAWVKLQQNLPAIPKASGLKGGAQKKDL